MFIVLCMYIHLVNPISEYTYNDTYTYKRMLVTVGPFRGCNVAFLSQTVHSYMHTCMCIHVLHIRF